MLRGRGQRRSRACASSPAPDRIGAGMTEAERELRDKIATEIAECYGSLGPYGMVQQLVRTGEPPPKVTLKKRK